LQGKVEVLVIQTSADGPRTAGTTNQALLPMTQGEQGSAVGFDVRRERSIGFYLTNDSGTVKNIPVNNNK